VYQYVTKDSDFKKEMFCNYLTINITPDYPISDSYKDAGLQGAGLKG
jgi:hypothetical protein